MDLLEVAEALAFWRQGAKLKELSKRFPFMTFDRLSQAHEDGNPVETQWDILIGDDTFLAYRELLLALHEAASAHRYGDEVRVGGEHRAYAYREDGYLTKIRELTSGTCRFDLDPAGRVKGVNAMAGWSVTPATPRERAPTSAHVAVTVPGAMAAICSNSSVGMCDALFTGEGRLRPPSTASRWCCRTGHLDE